MEWSKIHQILFMTKIHIGIWHPLEILNQPLLVSRSAILFPTGHPSLAPLNHLLDPLYPFLVLLSCPVTALPSSSSSLYAPPISPIFTPPFSFTVFLYPWSASSFSCYLWPTFFLLIQISHQSLEPLGTLFLVILLSSSNSCSCHQVRCLKPIPWFIHIFQAQQSSTSMACSEDCLHCVDLQAELE